MRTFETEYQLEEWRKIESEYFDSDGNAFGNQNIADSTKEQMLKLINQLDSELMVFEQDKNAKEIPVITDEQILIYFNNHFNGYLKQQSNINGIQQPNIPVMTKSKVLQMCNWMFDLINNKK